MILIDEIHPSFEKELLTDRDIYTNAIASKNRFIRMNLNLHANSRFLPLILSTKLIQLN